jgi:hypothetical protein
MIHMRTRVPRVPGTCVLVRFQHQREVFRGIQIQPRKSKIPIKHIRLRSTKGSATGESRRNHDQHPAMKCHWFLGLMLANTFSLSSSFIGSAAGCGAALRAARHGACIVRKCAGAASLSLQSSGSEPLRGGGEEAAIQFYFWPSPNGHKVAIMLEELGMPYEVRPINIAKGEQHTEEFLKLNPNNKVPTIVDPDGPSGSPFTVFESGAIMLYLGEKANRFLGGPPGSAERHRVTQWLMFQMASVGPMVACRSSGCVRLHCSWG